MTLRDSLDNVLSQLMHEADNWARMDDKNVKEIGSEAEKKDMNDDAKINIIQSNLIQDDSSHLSNTRDMCLEQIAKAISAHVTDILINRLGIEEKDKIKGSQSTSKRTGISSKMSESISIPSNRTFNGTFRINSRDNVTVNRRFRSENRLERMIPPPQPNEPPLENRASRLRRASLDRRRTHE